MKDKDTLLLESIYEEGFRSNIAKGALAGALALGGINGARADNHPDIENQRLPSISQSEMMKAPSAYDQGSDPEVQELTQMINMAIKKGDKKEAEVLLDELKTWIEMKTSLVKQAQDTHYQFMDAIEKIDQVANFEAPPESPNVD